MSKFSHGFQSFKEGLDWKLIGDYWRAVREHAWETLWGAGMVGIPFGLLTLYYAPSRAFLPWLIVWVVLVAGYYIWRADHIRLISRLNIARLHVEPARNESGRSVWIQIEPECLTEAVVESCQGWLLRVKHRFPPESGIGNSAWEPTSINEPLALGWSFGGFAPISLYPGVPQRLNVFSLYSELPNKTMPQPSVGSVPLKAWDVLTRQGSFRFEVQLRAKDCPPIHIAVEYEPGEPWDKPNVQLTRLEDQK